MKVWNGEGSVRAGTGTTDEHQAFAVASELFNKTLASVAIGQETIVRKAQAAVHEYVPALEPQKDDELSIALRLHVLKNPAPFFRDKRRVRSTRAAPGVFIAWRGQNATKCKPLPDTIKRN